MNETTKSAVFRAQRGDYKRYFCGEGIDIGAGGDPLRTPFGKVTAYDKPQGDATLMAGIQDSTYNFVYASHCLEHLQDIPKALQNWCRILKSGGYLYIVVPDWELYEHCQWPSKFAFDHKATFSVNYTRNHLKRSNHYFLPHDVGALVGPLGLRLLSVNLENYGYDYTLSTEIDQTAFFAITQISLVFQKTK